MISMRTEVALLFSLAATPMSCKSRSSSNVKDDREDLKYQISVEESRLDSVCETDGAPLCLNGSLGDLWGSILQHTPKISWQKSGQETVQFAAQKDEQSPRWNEFFLKLWSSFDFYDPKLDVTKRLEPYQVTLYIDVAKEPIEEAGADAQVPATPAPREIKVSSDLASMEASNLKICGETQKSSKFLTYELDVEYQPRISRNFLILARLGYFDDRAFFSRMDFGPTLNFGEEVDSYSVQAAFQSIDLSSEEETVIEAKVYNPKGAILRNEAEPIYEASPREPLSLLAITQNRAGDQLSRMAYLNFFALSTGLTSGDEGSYHSGGHFPVTLGTPMNVKDRNVAMKIRAFLMDQKSKKIVKCVAISKAPRRQLKGKII